MGIGESGQISGCHPRTHRTFCCVLPKSSPNFFRFYGRNGLDFRSCPAHLHSGLCHPCPSHAIVVQVDKGSGSLSQRPWTHEEPVDSRTGSHVRVYVTALWPMWARLAPLLLRPAFGPRVNPQLAVLNAVGIVQVKVIQSPSC